MDWRHRAACLTEDPELFFPVGNTGPALQQIEDAKKICQSCAVKDQCLNWALDAGQDHGVWGGTSEDERRAIRTTRNIAAHAGYRSMDDSLFWMAITRRVPEILDRIQAGG